MSEKRIITLQKILIDADIPTTEDRSSLLAILSIRNSEIEKYHLRIDWLSKVLVDPTKLSIAFVFDYELRDIPRRDLLVVEVSRVSILNLSVIPSNNVVVTFADEEGYPLADIRSKILFKK